MDNNITKPLVNINNWCVITDPSASPYDPPELHGKCLYGTVTGHPKKSDGMDVVTSQIIRVAGRVVETRNTTYRLLKPSEQYVEYCLKDGYPDPTDSDEPIRIRKG